MLPLIDIYRKYYGWKLALSMTGVFYLAMVAAGLIVEWLFAWTGRIPIAAGSLLAEVEHIGLDYTSVLNVVLGVGVLALIWWAKRTGSSHEHSSDRHSA